MNCSEKRKFRTEASALAAAGTKKSGAKFLRAYLCPRCKSWHLTHQRKKS